ncbi:phytanoyl-CoA dioxygenase family protein [Kiloniella antarctica]|uniref:Phytanoyl-CoA dioxygenase family protein n=1 Tax=Kiloniella antarctica TaxID=1550907 RepID=A0ABW5BQT8_9PROT
MNFVANKSDSTFNIITLVKKYGVCVVPDFISAQNLLPLNNEFDQIIDREYGEGFYEHGCRDYMDAIAVSDNHLLRSPFSAEIELVTTPAIRKFAKKFYNKDTFYIQHIFNVKSTETPKKSSELPYSLHFDKIHMLKFFFLLSDTDEDCGPTWVVPGQQKKSFQLRKKWHNEGGSVQSINNDLHYLDNEAIPIIGTAGSLIILDTDIPHKAGIVAKHRYRKVIRVSMTCPAYASIDLRRNSE